MDRQKTRGGDMISLNLNNTKEKSKYEDVVSKNELYFKQPIFKDVCPLEKLFVIISDVLSNNNVTDVVLQEIYDSLCQFIEIYEFDRFFFNYCTKNRILINDIEEVEFIDFRQGEWVSNNGEDKVLNIIETEKVIGSDIEVETKPFLSLKNIFNLILTLVLQESGKDISLSLTIKILSLYENILGKEIKGERVNDILISKFGYSTIYKYFKNSWEREQEINYHEALLLSKIINSEKIICAKFQRKFQLLITFAKKKLYDKNLIECTKVLNILLKTTNTFMKDFLPSLLTFYSEYCIIPNNFVCINLRDLNILLEAIEILINKMTHEKYENLLHNLYNNFLNNISLLLGSDNQSISMKEEIYCYCSNLFIVYKLYENISKFGLRGLTIPKHLFNFDNGIIYDKDVVIEEENTNNSVKTLYENNIFLNNLSNNEQIYLSNIYFNSKYDYMMLFIETERLISEENVQNNIKHTIKYDLYTNGRFVNNFNFLKKLEDIFSIEADYINSINDENFIILNPSLLLKGVATCEGLYIKHMFTENNISELYFTTLAVINKYNQTGIAKDEYFLLFQTEKYNFKREYGNIILKRHILMNELLAIQDFHESYVKILQTIIETELNTGMLDKLMISHIMTLPENKKTRIILKFVILKLNEIILNLTKNFPLSSICKDIDIYNPSEYRYLVFIFSLIFIKYGIIDFDIKFYHHTYIAVLLNRTYTDISFNRKILIDIFRHSLVCNDFQRNEIKCITKSNCMNCSKMYKGLINIRNIF